MVRGDHSTVYAPLTAALSEFAGTREPNGVVGHFEGRKEEELGDILKFRYAGQ